MPRLVSSFTPELGTSSPREAERSGARVLESLSEMEQLYRTAGTGTMRWWRVRWYSRLPPAWLRGPVYPGSVWLAVWLARGAQHASAQAAPTLGGHPPTRRRSITPDVMGLQSVSLSLCPRAGSYIVSLKCISD
jgi:hypothetical protein